MSDERNTDAGSPGDDVELNDDYDSEEPEVDELEADDEAEERDEPEEPTDEPAQERQRPQRRGRRERQTAELRATRERIERLERDLQAARQQQQAQTRIDPAEQYRRDEAERQQVALLPYEQQSLYWSQKSEQRIAAALLQQRAELSDTIERSSWEQRCLSDPMRRRYAAKVEETLNTYPAGQTRPPREVVYRYLVGEEVDRKRSADTGRQRSQAARRVRNQTTQPGNGRSDAPRERTGNRSNDDSLEALRRRVYGSGRPLW